MLVHTKISNAQLTLTLVFCSVFGHNIGTYCSLSIWFVNENSTTYSNRQYSTLSAPTDAVGGLGRAATAGVKGETSLHVTVWAFSGLSLHCYYLEEAQLRAYVCDPLINLHSCPHVPLTWTVAVKLLKGLAESHQNLYYVPTRLPH